MEKAVPLEYELPSKTQRKRDMHALQDLGTALTALSVDRIRALNLPEGLERAIIEAKSLKSHGAIRRQLQYVGKLMREVDPAPIRAYLDRLAGASREAAASQHLAERWRDRILEDVAAADAFCVAFPSADRQQLRNLALGAQHERSEQKPPRKFRELFRTIARAIEQGHG
jgi:ribosome-associated protein